MAAAARPTLPKAELHLHIEGTLEPELALTLAERNRVALPETDPESLRRRYRFDSLQSFLDVYYATMAVLRTERDFADLAAAYLERAGAQGVRHAEIFFDPQAHVERGVPLERAVDGLWSVLATSQSRFGVSTQLIMCFLRDRGPGAAMRTLEAALPRRDRITGVGLDSSEVGYPPSAFAEVFARARGEGFHCVAHAGEEGPPAYVRQALDLLGVERIDHGNRCLEDAELMARLREEQVPLTVCPLSNLRLGVVGRLEEHPLARMLEAGLNVSVNSDDPAYFGGYIDDNYALIQRALRLSDEQMVGIAEASFRASFLGGEKKAAHLAELAAVSRGVSGLAPAAAGEGPAAAT